MTHLTVQYFRDMNDPTSGLWQTLPPPNNLPEALLFARDGFADVRDYLGATGFKIMDHNGAVVAEEMRPVGTKAAF